MLHPIFLKIVEHYIIKQNMIVKKQMTLNIFEEIKKLIELVNNNMI